MRNFCKNYEKILWKFWGNYVEISRKFYGNFEKSLLNLREILRKFGEIVAGSLCKSEISMKIWKIFVKLLKKIMEIL